jgi:dTDP-4-dehydrorhamnose 3,5-epimerase
MKILKTKLDGVLIIEPTVFPDGRGYFYESFHETRYVETGIPSQFVQDNFSHSVKDVIRGLHYQLERPQGKLILVSTGRILDVIVDIRRHSKTFGKSLTIELSAENPRQVYIPPGFAHGFCVLSENANVTYKCSDYYHPASERGILWNDPSLNIPWPTKDPILSPKDAIYPLLKDVSSDHLPQ